jgi:hypothetical protein
LKEIIPQQVERTYFRVHSYFFIRQSNYWKNELVGSVPAHREQADEPLRKGNSLTDPVVIKDVKPADFVRLLDVIYNECVTNTI